MNRKTVNQLRFLVTWIFLLYAILLQGQENFFSYRFTNLTLEDGLADNWSHDALMDSRGYMWFATQDGLSLYDGKKFSNFQYLEEDSFSLSGNILMELMEGKDGLWIASNGGGLNFFNPETEQFTNYMYDATDTTSISANTAVSLFKDKEDLIWVGTYDRGFNRFNPQTGTFKRFNLSSDNENLRDAFKRNSVLDIVADRDNPDLLWLAANNGLYSFHKRKEELRYWSSPLINGETLNCHKIQYGKPGELWVAVAGAGMCSYNIEENKWTVHPSELNFWERGNIYANLIFDMERKSEKEWWISHKTRGLGIFNEATGNYKFAKHDPVNPFSIISEEGFGIYKDLEGRLWFLSFQQGVSFLDPSYQMFNYHALQSQVCSPGVFNEVKAFAKDKKSGKTYVVTKGCDGLYVFDENQKLIDWAPSSLRKERLQEFVEVLIDSKERVWVLNKNKEKMASLLEYNPQSGFCEPFQHPQLDHIPLHSFGLKDIIEDQDQNLWLATEAQGLLKIDFKVDTIIQYVKTLESESYIDPAIEISELKLDSKGSIWIATISGGVFVFDPQKETFLQFGKDFGEKNALLDAHVLTLEEDYLGRIWAGTNSKGIQLINSNIEEDQSLGSFGRSDGLPGEQVSRIRKDHSGNIWVATNKGLSKYNIKEKSFSSFGKKNGLIDIFLIGKGMDLGADGTMFIGQNWSFYSFHPDSVFINKTPPPVRLTFFKVFEENRDFGKNINFLEEIRLKHNENFFTVGFSCLNFSEPEKNQYAYKLEGFDKDLVYTSDGQAIAPYTNVDPGEYVLKVIAANNDGIWNDAGHSLKIIITPPFWKTNWFYGLCIALVFSFMYAFYRWRLNAISRKARIETQLAELELKALRSQMNPHFIFNSLNAIKLLIQSERKNEAADYLTKFSKMIRGVLHHSDRKIISLTEELEIAKLFLSMEELRFQKKFEYNINVNPDLDPDMINVPPLIFQPYLENAIWHGLMHLEKEGRVSLNIEQNNGLVQCIIDDNGIGREMAQRIKGKRQARHKSVGISITQERLRLNKKLNNSQMGVEIVDKKNEAGKATGTTIIINLN